MVKLDINANNFLHSGSNSIKVTFLASSHQAFRKIYILYYSAEVHIFHCFSIVFGNDIIMTSFLVAWFSSLHILWNFE